MDERMNGQAAVSQAGQQPTGFPFRTLQVTGALVANLGKVLVEDIAIDCTNGGLRMAVFAANDVTRLYDVYQPRGIQLCRRVIGLDGSVAIQARPPRVERQCCGREKARAEGDVQKGT